jgi:hypothetical protein
MWRRTIDDLDLGELGFSRPKATGRPGYESALRQPGAVEPVPANLISARSRISVARASFNVLLSP